MLDTYQLINMAITGLLLIGLVIGWKDLNARCLLITVLAVKIVNDTVLIGSNGLGEWYYLIDILMNVMIAFVVLARKYIAKVLSKSMYDDYSFNLQDGAIIGMCLVSCLADCVVLAEGLLYSLYIIDTGAFRTYLYNPLQFMAGSLISLAAFSYAVNSTTNK